MCLGTINILGQSEYIDRYLVDSLKYTVIGTSADRLSQPRDLDFKHFSNELWVVNYGTANGGTNVIFYNAGQPNQRSEYRKDSHSSHFMCYPSALSFGDDGRWASVGEIQSTAGPGSTFMGPSLWSSDTSIFARVFQNNWITGKPLGSHYDMLHQSPYAMGIAHDTALAYWVADGWNGTICKYNYEQDHGPGYEDHSHGKVWRYTDVPFTRVAGVPSHLVMDKSSGWLYFVDGGTKTVKRLNTTSGSIAGNLTASNETLSGYYSVVGAKVEVIDSFKTQPCGIDYFNGRLIVSDYDSGFVYIYDVKGVPKRLGVLRTEHPNIMGIRIGPDGKIWFVNSGESKIYRIDPTRPQIDVAVRSIDAPVCNNYDPGFYSTEFNVCEESVIPAITIVNNGAFTINSAIISYKIDGASPVVLSWNGELKTDSVTRVILPSSNINAGEHTLAVSISEPNNKGDEVSQNNVMQGAFRSIGGVKVLPFNEGFLSTTFPPAGWQYVNYNPNCRMSRFYLGGFTKSSGSMKMDNFSGAEDITGQKDYLISPRIDFSKTAANISLQFSTAYAKRKSTSNDELQVSVSTDCGSSWDVVFDQSGTELSSTTSIMSSAFSPNSSQWRSQKVDLTAYAGNASVMLMFTTTSNYGNNLYLDDIAVSALVSDVKNISDLPDESAYPNPVVGSVLTLNTMAYSEENITVSIVNVEGIVVCRAVSTKVDDRLKIDVSTLQSGMYYLQILAGEKTSVSKFVKQ